MGLELIKAKTTAVYHDEEDSSTCDIELENGDTFEKIPLLLPLGTNENIEGYIQLDKEIDIYVIKGFGSNWLAIGEISRKPNKKSQNQILLEEILKSIKKSSEANKDISKAIQDIGDCLITVSSATAGVHPTGLSNASSISSCGNDIKKQGKAIDDNYTKKIEDGDTKTQPRFKP